MVTSGIAFNRKSRTLILGIPKYPFQCKQEDFKKIFDLVKREKATPGSAARQLPFRRSYGNDHMYDVLKMPELTVHP